MTIRVGQKIYYVGRGPCVVAEVVSKVVCGASAKFFRFVMLNGNGEEILVPTASAATLPLRALTAVNKIPELLKRLTARSEPPKPLASWRERELFRLRMFQSGSPLDLGELIESLTRSSGVRKLAADEWEALLRARKLLIAEIAEVMGESSMAAESRVDQVLKSKPYTPAVNN